MIKKIIVSIFLFLLFYLDSIHLGPIKWSQLWKGFFVLIMMGYWMYIERKSIKMFNIYFTMLGFYFVTPFLFVNFFDIIIKITEYFFFPSIFMFILYLSRKNHSVQGILSYISILFIFSFIPFYFNLIPELGKKYDLIAIGVLEGGLSGLFQQPHAASQILAYSSVSLLFLILKKDSKSQHVLIFILFLSIFLLIQTYVRLGILMTFVGFTIMLIYKTNLRKRVKYAVVISLILIITPNFITNDEVYVPLQMRALGNTQYNTNSADYQEIDYNRISSGRIKIWEASLTSLFEKDNALEILFGIGETELIKRNKNKIGYAVFSHNGFIDMLVTNGFVGLILFILFLINWYDLLRQAQRVNFKNSIEHKFALSIFLMYLISVLLQGDVIIYEGIFITLSILLIYSKKELSNVKR